MVRRILKGFFSQQGSINVSNIYHSVVTVWVGVWRPRIKLNLEWFTQRLEQSLDHEIKSKYVPGLHQNHAFERQELFDILNFRGYINQGGSRVGRAIESLEVFASSYNNFIELLIQDEIKIIAATHPLVKATTSLSNAITSLNSELQKLSELLQLTDYNLLDKKGNVYKIELPLDQMLLTRPSWYQFLDKRPISDDFLLGELVSFYNAAYQSLVRLNDWINDFHNRTNIKVITGNAGTGKTHISAHLVETLRRNQELIIFLKARRFSGDNLDFPSLFLRELNIHPTYRLEEILSRLQAFAQKRNKRCFIIIDALNETTKSTVGFSNIWHFHLQQFINTIRRYSHLYFICTLRTSYIEHIWGSIPFRISELRGFDNEVDVRQACDLYFKEYLIKPLDIDTADLKPFQTPLLLDLFCKMVNSKRENWIEISLSVHTYLEIFRSYTEVMIKEVQHKRNLASGKQIRDGITKSSSQFIKNIEATLLLDDFIDSFDKKATITVDESIAAAVLDGYLLFIKDAFIHNQEIVKHTQQETGGYLLATWLHNQYPNTADLVSSVEYQEKLFNFDKDKNHQLRNDILKFLVVLRPDIITLSNETEILEMGWWYLYNGYNHNNPELPQYLLDHRISIEIVDRILSISQPHWLDISTPNNFHFIAKLLAKLDIWSFELIWTKYIYDNADYFFDNIHYSLDEVKKAEATLTQLSLLTNLNAFVTATTIRVLRDNATYYLLLFGMRFPASLAEVTYESAKISDKYIYERLVSCVYGTALILQHDKFFLENQLPQIASMFFELQFARTPTLPVYNYIVTDSIKHLLDLAIHKGVWLPTKEDGTNIAKYSVEHNEIWEEPTGNQKTLINNIRHETNYPEPIRMDFGIYTIPRLLKENKSKTEAVTQVYKRIYELGYKNIKLTPNSDLSSFYYGEALRYAEGKVDRLGKKYCWKALFDFAGYLLKKSQLNVFDKILDSGIVYQRLSDVDIDISNLPVEYETNKRIYIENLIKDRSTNLKWYSEVKIDTLTPIFIYKFEDIQYVMLRGFVDQRINEKYDVRSFLLANSFFINKCENIEQLQQVINDKTFEWRNDIDIEDRIRHTYFGELYWADNMPDQTKEEFRIPSGSKKIHKHRITQIDVLTSDNYTAKDIGKEFDEEYDMYLSFDAEPTLSDYLWETTSDTFAGLHEYYPSIQMGKFLGLRPAPVSKKILDDNLNECFQSVSFNEDHFKNDFSYMRLDLLHKYMQENDRVLVFQIKQHSYDNDNMHNRSMKYFIYQAPDKNLK